MILEFMSRSFPFVSLMFGRIKMLMPKISNEIIKRHRQIQFSKFYDASLFIVV